MQYQIEGDSFPVVICKLTPGETMICQSGAMSWMNPDVKMETTTNGGIGAMFGRMFSGESLFMNRYTAGNKESMIAFSSSFPGKILPLEITPGKEMIVQKTGYLASTANVKLSVFLQKKIGAGLVGGEGFILEKLSGEGTAFLEIDGSCIEYELAAGQQLVINTGYFAAADSTCSIDVKTVSGMKNILFGGEGIFNTVITGPGKVYIQTKPIASLAAVLKPFFPTQTSSSGS